MGRGTYWSDIQVKAGDQQGLHKCGRPKAAGWISKQGALGLGQYKQ